MAIRRITISVPDAIAVRIKKAAGDSPVSAWVTERIEQHLEDAELERQWQEFYQDVSPRRDDVRRAETLFKRLTRRSRRGAA